MEIENKCLNCNCDTTNTSKYEMHKITSCNYTNQTYTTNYLTKTIDVPYCKKCKSKYENLMLISGFGTLLFEAIFVYIVFNGKFSSDSSAAPIGKLIFGGLFLLIPFFGLWYLPFKYLIFKIKQVPDQYPIIKALEKEEWKTGKKP